MSKLELLQVEHDKVEFETKNVDGANSNLKRELEEKNRESVRMKTENVRLMQSIADYRHSLIYAVNVDTQKENCGSKNRLN